LFIVASVGSLAKHTGICANPHCASRYAGYDGLALQLSFFEVRALSGSLVSSAPE